MTSRDPIRRLQRAITRLTVMTVVALLPATVGSAQDLLAITAPANNDVVNHGQSVSVTVTSPAGASFAGVALLGDLAFGLNDLATAVPAQFSVPIPATAAAGAYVLTAMGRTTGGVQATTTIVIRVERPDAPTALSAMVPQVIFERPGASSSIDLQAEFADGARLTVTQSSNVTYASSDPAIATVSATGHITAVGVGSATITATYGQAPNALSTTILAVVDEPLFSVSPAALAFGNQTVGTASSQQVTLTNSGSEDLLITTVSAEGDFSETNNCLSNTLAPSATCTISVTFNPAEAGARQGALHVGNGAAMEELALGGTGVAPDPVTIASFTPTSGLVGAGVTITGTGFSMTPAQNSVTFNGTSATVTSSTATTIETTVPVGATTGGIAVTSPLGSATSATSFTVIVPEPPTIVSFTPMVGVAGTSVTITGTNFDLTPANNQTKFNNVPATPTASTATTVTAPVPAAAGSGRITITTAGGSVTSTDDFIVPPSPFTASDVAASGRLPFGTATAVSVPTANKIGLWLFDGTAGQRISLLGTNGVSGQILGCDVNVSLLKPDLTVLAPATCMELSGYVDLKTLPSTGTYAILVDPAGAATGGVTLTLHNVPADFSGTIVAGGSSVTASTTVAGQNAALTFTGSAGQRVSVRGTNGMTGQIGLACDVSVSIIKPDATTLVAPTCMEGSGYIDVVTLPAAGTYTLFIDPLNWATGNLTLTLYDVPADVTDSLTAGGSAVTVSMPVPGQRASLTFSGTWGQTISLRGTNGLSAQIGLACDVNVKILKPDTSTLVANTCMEGSGFVDATVLPVTGTYTVVVDPVDWAVGSLTLQLYDVPANVTGSVTVGGSAAAVTIGTPGQNGAVTFNGTASQQVTVRVTGNTMGAVTVRLLKPDGTALTLL